MNSPQRVADRFLEGLMSARIAGVFDPPPKMSEDILRWMLAVYCGHVLTRIDLRISTLQDAITPIRNAISDMQKHQDGLLERLERMKPGEEIKIHLYSSFHPIEAVRLGVQASESAYFDGKSFHHPYLEKGEKMVIPPEGVPALVFTGAGKKLPGGFMSQPPIKVYGPLRSMLEEGIRRAERTLAHLENNALDSDESTTSRIQALREMEKLCLQHTVSRKAYKSSAKRVFPVDLTGWRYAQKVPPEAIREVLSTSWKGGVTCRVNFVKHKRSIGTWDSYSHELDVDIASADPQSIETLKDQIVNLTGTLYHETRHMGQYLLASLLKLKETAGLPSKSIRYTEPTKSKDHSNDGRKEHALLDIEFQTRLGDEITRFKLYWKDRVESGPTKTKRQEMGMWLFDSRFFTMLKKHEPLKWQKAVSEFYKAVSGE